MTRISTFCVLSSTLAVIALSANGASAVTITVHTTVPRVIVHVPQPKVTVHTPQLKILSNHGTVVGTKSRSNHVLLKGGSIRGIKSTTALGNTTTTIEGAKSTTALGNTTTIIGGAKSTTALGNTTTIIGYQEGNPDRPIIIGSVYNATPSFSFNKIDPAGKASVVSVLQVGAQSSGAGAGKITYNPFTITRTTDVASPSLFQALVSNQTSPKATLSFARPSFVRPNYSIIYRGTDPNPITPQTPRIEKLNTHRVEK